MALRFLGGSPICAPAAVELPMPTLNVMVQLWNVADGRLSPCSRWLLWVDCTVCGAVDLHDGRLSPCSRWLLWVDCTVYGAVDLHSVLGWAH